MRRGADHHIAAVDLGGERPVAEHRPLGRRHHGAVVAQLLEEGHRRLGLEPHHAIGVLGQVLADALEIHDRADAVRDQLVRRPDAGQHQQLGRIERPAAEDHLALGADLTKLALLGDLDPHRAAGLNQDPGGQRLHLQRQVRATERRMQIGAIGAGAPAALVDGHLALGEALGDRAGKVVGHVVAGVLGRLHQGVVQQQARVDGPDAQGPRAAVVLALAPPAGLHPLEVGQHVRIAPALAAHLPPGVVVVGVAAHVEHAVDRGRSAQHLAARRGQTAVVQGGDRLGGVAPGHARHEHGLQEAERHVDVGVAVLAAGLDHQHADVLVLAEPLGQHATRRAGADDDVVVGLGRGTGHTGS